MSLPILAITLDLDDTLWPFAPIGARIEQALHDWLRAHSPATAVMFPVAKMRALRERVFEGHPRLHHDMGALRRLTLYHALRGSGADMGLLDPAYEVFLTARNQVEFYPDALPALRRIAARVPVAAVSNGNADLARIGIAGLFAFQLGAREFGAGKPDPGIFRAACARLGMDPACVLHAGDHAETDVIGAMRAGLRGGWINRERHAWPRDAPPPDLHFNTLAELADWLDANPHPTRETA